MSMSVSAILKFKHRAKSTGRLAKGNTGGRCARLSLLVVALGVTATVVASPPAGGVPAKAAISDGTAAKATHRWFQIGKASWYGGKFQGRKTANGERFDMNALTCAHRSLPLGSWVRVTNLRNQKTAYLRVNDRGPVPENLIVDLSYAAAQKLGISGLGKVKIETVTATDSKMAEELVASLPPLNQAVGLPVAKSFGR
jgi:rare lipoprotein A